MACFCTARLFHTSCRIVHIQLSVSDAFQVSTSNKTYWFFWLNFQLVRPVFMDNPEQDFFLFPLRFPVQPAQCFKFCFCEGIGIGLVIIRSSRYIIPSTMKTVYEAP